MQKGYVFETVAEGFFGIFFFTAPFVMIRVIPDARNVEQACDSLSRDFAGHFMPARPAHEDTGLRIMKRHDTLVLR